MSAWREPIAASIIALGEQALAGELSVSAAARRTKFDERYAREEFVIEDSDHESRALVSSSWRTGRATGRDASMRLQGNQACAVRDQRKLIPNEPIDPARGESGLALTKRCTGWALGILPVGWLASTR